MQCRNCGATLEPEARFCQDCGTPVDGQPARQIYQSAQAGYKPAKVATRRRISGRNIAIGVICIALIVGAGFGAASLLGLNGPASQGAPSSSAPVVEESSSSSAAAEESSSASASSEASEESSSSTEASKKSEGFNPFKAEEKAKKDAQDAGMQVFTGTVHMTTYGQRASEVNSKLSSGVSIIADDQLALLTFGVQENVSALSSGGYGEIETRYNQDSLSLGNPWQWQEYDGQLITVAAYPEDLMFPNDIAGYLYSAAGNAEIIAPLDEQGYADLSFYRQGLPDPLPELPTSIPSSPDKKSSSSEKSSGASTPSDGSYVLPESSTRTYSRSELSGLSDYELFIARNEIYARHGRKFQSDDLQKYFDSKSWYKGTIEASAFDESVLSDTEVANTTLIREIETAHNSPYL